MLELGQLIGDLSKLSAEALAGRAVREQQMTGALELAQTCGDAWAKMAERIARADTRWLNGVPLYADQPVGTPIDPPAGPSAYTVIATDGSQIPLDRHSPLPYYVINTGEVVIHYGHGERASLKSNAKLYYQEADILIGGSDGSASYVGERQIAAERMRRETQALKKLVTENESRDALLTLVDGTLVLWAQEGEQEAQSKTRDQSVNDLVDLFASAFACNALVAGYISRPRSREVVNALKVTLYPEGVTTYNDYPAANLEYGGFSRLTDAGLFEKILKTGQRSTVFASQSKVLDDYERVAAGRNYSDPKEYRVGFFYINVGSEIARVEIPLKIARDSGLVGKLHALVLDQATKGLGYPVALQEAHEQAIVRGPERAAFASLVERQCVRDGIAVYTSRKALAKQSPFT